MTDDTILNNDIFWMLGFAAVLILLILIPKRLEIGRLKGILLVGAYAAFIYMAFL